MTKSYYNSLVTGRFPADIEIVGTCELEKYQHNWRALYHALKPYQDREFQHNQRLMILDHDTDYYPNEHCVGNNLYNLIKLFAKLNISTDHVVILTGNYGLEPDVELISRQFNLTAPRVIEFSQWYVYPVVGSIRPEPRSSDFSHLYVCLNYQPRTHRMILMALLNEKNLLESGITSWFAPQDIPPEKLPSIEHLATPDLANSYFRTTDPFTRINDDLNLCQSAQELLIRNHSALMTTRRHELITGEPNQSDTRWTAGFFRHALLYLITETVGQYRHVYFSEKIWKAMASCMPFLLLGAQHSLATLKRLGFKTFESIWDESYDEATTLYERANRITDVLVDLNQRDWQQLAKQCEPIVQHNFENLGRLQQQHLEQLAHL
jgi:hypothetical protein